MRNIATLGTVRKCGLSVMASLLVMSSALAKPVAIPANTKIYVVVNEDVSGKKKRTHEGQVVRASVWRDVIIEGSTVISAGTPVLVRVDSLKGAKIAGIKGKMSLGAYETNAIGNTPLQLGGGYNKEGKGRVALVASLAGILFLPLIFMKGKSANIPKDTVFDAYVDHGTTVEVGQRQSPKINLGEMFGGLHAEVLYDELEAAEKPEVFPFLISAPSDGSGEFFIIRVNNVAIEPIALHAKRLDSDGEGEIWRGEVGIKKLSKEFKKGINTLEIATTRQGEDLSTEVVLDIAF